ncbi:hypothetical protein BLNAU_4088 [Blattamonas nauphoetae]|uniref:TmcB/TmcC TPR repeats domain-containing protein n=1 Tax=Blattamonas nauphoetae TaxID=2049346 RepID=A0ABQ9YB52_9EUKA|nr:hypothetical protein BLNAU_4088 [Blattamonas nauphoetae]
MEDERKSTNSALTASSFDGGSFDISSKKDNLIFNLLFPLYEKPKRPPRVLPMIGYCFVFFELVTLSFFSLDSGTKMPTVIGKALGYTNLASLAFPMKDYYGYVPIGISVLLILLVVALVFVSRLYQWLLTHQPWILSVTKLIFLFFFQVLIIPFVNLSINAFDCYTPPGDSTPLYRALGTTCLGSDDTLSMVAGIVAIVFLVLYFAAVMMYHYFIFRSNPKRGGLFAAPSGKFQTCIAVLVMGLVFCQRLLVDWAFWRAVVSVGTAAGIILAVIMMQPFYSRTSNFLVVLLFSVYGTLRLGLEIGFLIDSGTGTIVGTIVFGVVGIGGGIGLSFLFLHLLKVQERRTWGVTITKDNEVLPRFDLASEEGKHKLMQHVGRKGVEPTVRFILRKNIRTRPLTEYADGIYTFSIMHRKEDKVLLLHYAQFLLSITKNRVKAQVLLQQCKKSNPGIMNRFIIHCVMKGESAENGSGGGEAMELNLKAHLEKAENDREDARDAQIEFYENMSKQKPNFILLQKQLSKIVLAENAAQKSYEELLSQHPNNVAVLRSYGVMLQRILRDEDMADYILSKADQIEEDQSDSMPGMDFQMRGGVRGDGGHQGSLAPRRKKKKKKEAQTVNVDDLLGTHQADTAHVLTIGVLAISITHLIGVAGLIVAHITIRRRSTMFVDSLNNVKDIGTIIGGCTQISVLALELLIHEYNLNWLQMNDTGHTIKTVPEIISELNKTGTELTKLVRTVYEGGSETGVWERVDIPYGFITYDEVNRNVTNVYQENKNYLSLVSDITQFGLAMGSSTDPKTDVEAMHNRMLTLMFNCYQPLYEAGKRAVTAYTDNAFDCATVMYSLTILIVGLSSLVVLILIVATYAVFAITSQSHRKKLLRECIEVKKSALNKISRTLLDEDDSETTQLRPEMEEADDGESMLETERLCEDEDGDQKQKSSSEEEMEEIKEDSTKQTSNSLTPDSSHDGKKPDTADSKLASVPNELPNTNTESVLSDGEPNAKIFSPPRNLHRIRPLQSNTMIIPPNPMTVPPHSLRSVPTQPENKFNNILFTERSLLTQRDEDEEERQTRRDDDAWEEKYENDVANLDELHKSIRGIVPLTTRITMPTHFVLILLLVTGVMTATIMSIKSLSNSVDNVLPATFCPAILSQCNYFLLALAFQTEYLTYPEIVPYPSSTHPVWQDSSHLTDKQDVLSTYFAGTVRYFRMMSLVSHFGQVKPDTTQDKTIDAVRTDRFSTDFNVKTLLMADTCFMRDRSACEALPLKSRLYESYEMLPGFQALMSRFYQYAEFLKKEDPVLFDQNHPLFLFLNSALQYDLHDGSMHEVEMMSEAYVKNKDTFLATSLALTIAGCFMYVLILLLVIAPYVSFKRIRIEDTRLQELVVQLAEDGDKARMVGAMMTNDAEIDDGREKIVATLNSTIQIFKDKESNGMLESMMDEFVTLVKRQFRMEENRMKEGTTSLDRSAMEKHRMEHRICLQRLRYLFDGLRSTSLSRQAISIRQLLRLFDSHFLSADIAAFQTGEADDKAKATESSPRHFQ